MDPPSILIPLITAHAYLCGDKKTIADLSAACELDQGQWVALELNSKYPRVGQWYQKMIAEDEINYQLAAHLRKSCHKITTWVK